MMLKEVTNLNYIEVVNKGIVFGADYQKIPNTIFSKIVDVVIYYAKKELEIMFYLNYKRGTNNYVVTIPNQKVSSYRIKVSRTDKTEYKEIDIVSGKEVNLSSLIRLGTIHSHHKLEAKFSIEDDLNDMSNPPGLHILLGEYPTFKVVSSFVVNKQRYYIPTCNVIDGRYMYSYNEGTIKKLNNVIKTIINKL